MNCPTCGQPVEARANFCNNCGARLDAVTGWNQSGFGQDPYAENEQALATFVGYSNTEKYLRAWRTAANPESSVRWHWPAFFLGAIWYAYRKMYKWVWAIVGAQVLLGILNLMLPKFVGSLLGIGLDVACSLFAYPLYYRHAMRQIEQARHMSADGNVYLPELQKRGGTSGGAVAVVIIGYIVLGVLIGVAAILVVLHQYGGLNGINSVNTFA